MDPESTFQDHDVNQGKQIEMRVLKPIEKQVSLLKIIVKAAGIIKRPRKRWINYLCEATTNATKTFCVLRSKYIF